VSYVVEELAKQGHLTKSFFGKRGGIAGHVYSRMTLGAAVKCLSAIPQADVLVVHRAGDPITALLIKVQKRLGGMLVFDIDDAVYLRWNILTMSIPQIVKASDFVVVGSHEIANYCRQWNKNVHIIPSGVDTNLFHPSSRVRSKHKPVVGWLGDGRVHGRNLEVLVEPLLALADRCDFKFKMVSALGSSYIRGAFSKLAARIEIDFGLRRWVDISLIPEMVSDFDVSVMPLIDDDFNRAKGGQKLLESMSMEIPVVASAVGENKYIVSHGSDGLLVSSADEWEAALASLLNDPERRHTFGKAGRRKILERYSKDVCASHFARILEATRTRTTT